MKIKKRIVFYKDNNGFRHEVYFREDCGLYYKDEDSNEKIQIKDENELLYIENSCIDKIILNSLKKRKYFVFDSMYSS